MSDIWSSIGVDITSTEGEWLYRISGEVRGPVLHAAIVDKLSRGEIDLDTPVAREGGDFHPIGRVAAFAQHIESAQALLASRTAKRRRRIVGVLALILLAGVGAGGYFMWREFEQRSSRMATAERQKREEHRKRQKEILASQPKMELVALVSLGTKEDVKIRSAKRHRRRPATAAAAARGSYSRPEPSQDEFVKSCQLSQNSIFGTLRRHLRKLNLCVEDEKSRDTQGLLPETLVLEFVVKPNGQVVEFAIADRHFRRGPLNNCMTKAFRAITFAQTNGSNCPVTIPIKIGG